MGDFLSVGFATRDDFHGAWMTLETLLEFHNEHVDQIVIIDNSPAESKHATELANCVKHVKKVKYVRDFGEPSSCIHKSRVFTESDCEFAACCDSHVIFKEGAIAALREAWKVAPADCRDLLTGPCWAGSARTQPMGTSQMLFEHEGYSVPDKAEVHHMTLLRGGCMGVWVVDHRVTGDSPFEIRKSGTGFFSMRRDAWVGFNDQMRGHGGNESYLFEKIRAAGGRAACLPTAGWVHRFGRPEGAPYPLRWDDRVRNYVVGARELKRPDLERAALAHLQKICSTNVRRVLAALGPMPDVRKELRLQLGDAGINACPEGIADAIRQIARPGMKTLEMGSGYSTLVFDTAGCHYTALEDHAKHREQVASVVSDQVRVELCPMGVELNKDGSLLTYFSGSPPDHISVDGGYELVLIDGPRNAQGGNLRDGAEVLIDKLASKNATIIVDDTHRAGDRALSDRIAASRGLETRRYGDEKRQFDVLSPKLCK